MGASTVTKFFGCVLVALLSWAFSAWYLTIAIDDVAADVGHGIALGLPIIASIGVAAGAAFTLARWRPDLVAPAWLAAAIAGAGATAPMVLLFWAWTQPGA